MIDGMVTKEKSIRAWLPAFWGGVVGGVAVAAMLAGAALVALGVRDADSLKALVHDFAERNTVQHGSVSGVVSTSDDAVVNVVDRVNPAVVSIVITKDVPVMEKYYDDYGGPFGNLFRVPRYRQNGTESKEVGGGSGFLVSADGYVVTNRHVVSDAEAQYTVFLNDGTDHAATIVSTDDVLDIALLKIDAAGATLPFLEFGDSDAVKVGQTAVAIGNALGEFRNTVSVGVVSGLSRTIVAGDGNGSSEQLQNVLQTDAAINAGNSGGPLLNLDGYVIGVNVAASLGGSTENIAFALPANAVKSAVESMRQYGHVVRPYLGVRFTMITDDIVKKNNLTVDHGALVLRGDNGELAVVPGSPADKAGLEENDIILTVNGDDVTEDAALNTLLMKYAPDTSVTLHVLHDGEERDVTVTLGTMPTNG